MSTCKVCQQPHSRFFLHNKPLCLACDELTLDIEIELEESEEIEPARTPPRGLPERLQPKGKNKTK